MALALNAALWGGLRDHIDLPSLIFAKLPLDAFFRLRLVCKEWNCRVSDRAFLLQHFSSLQPPFFVVDTHSAARLLRCDSSGLLMEDSNSKRVFDVHTRMVHALPDVLREQGLPLTEEEERDYEEPLVGMIVDAMVKPHAFRVVLGDGVMRTGIHDSTSGLWTQKDSLLEDLMLRPRPGRVVSAYCDGILYIRVPSILNLRWLYNVQRDEWSIELLPVFKEDGWVCCDLEVWKDCMYLVGMHFMRPRRILVWELLKQPLSEGYPFGHEAFHDLDYDGTWGVFDVLPDDLWLWLFAGKEENMKQYCWDEFFHMRSRFCGEYVLVYNSVACEYFNEERGVLYNLNSRKWEKVDLPGSVLRIALRTARS